MPQIVTLDADGQHPAVEAVRLARHPRFDALILGVRNLKESGAPGPNRFSNAFSNLVLSGFAGRRLLDTQCGLRRYPVERTLVLGARDDGYAYESNLVLRAARFKLPIVHVPVSVIYPPEHERVSHFHSLRDPFKIVLSVVGTALTCFPRRRFSMPKDVPAA
jgi:hypothetical protein